MDETSGRTLRNLIILFPDIHDFLQIQSSFFVIRIIE